MRKIVLFAALSAAALFYAGDVLASRAEPVVRGRIVDEDNEGIGYATVVLLSEADSLQAAGVISDGDGRFSFKAPRGRYLVRFSYMGYIQKQRELTLRGDYDMGRVVMRPATTEVDEVTITARAITREADRFVVAIANNPIAIGKDAFEILRVAPGVWISGSDITINGRSGTQVMINDRMVRMSGEELESYLRSINAEDLAKIEVIPDSGAEYDADAGGGIIKITLRRQVSNGMDGSVSFNAGVGYYGNYYAGPSANINYKKGKFSLYANMGYSYNMDSGAVDEETVYNEYSAARPGVISTIADMTDKRDGVNVMFGAFYDIDDRQHIGLEFGAYGGKGNNSTEGLGIYRYDTPILVNDILVDNARTVSNYGTVADNVYYSGTLNYTYKLNDRGSAFKLIGDYMQNVGYKHHNTFESSRIPYVGAVAIGIISDTVYQSTTDNNFRVMSLTANFDFALSPAAVIKAGAKYTNNDIYSKLIYEVWNADTEMWNIHGDASSITDYNENVAALYAIYNNSALGRFDVSAGLRGEYTFVNPRYRGVPGAEYGGSLGGDNDDGSEIRNINEERGVRQCYFGLFPHLNVSYGLDGEKGHSLILAVSRSIRRPHFSYLSPFRIPLSDYAQVAGNPDLKAMYTNNFSLSAVFFHKYNITLAAQLMEDQIAQMAIPEGEMLIYQHVNIPRAWQYYVAVNAPVTFARWWSGNFNLAVGDIQQRLEAGGPRTRKAFGQIYGSMNFMLPADFDIELSGYAHSRFMQGNMEVLPMYNISVAVKKRFADNKFTASFGVNNILPVNQKVYSYGPGFHKWNEMIPNGIMTVALSLRYNFKAGEQFNARQVEKGSEEDAQRIVKGAR